MNKRARPRKPRINTPLAAIKHPAQNDLNRLHAVAPRSSITKFLEAVFLYHTGQFDASRDKLLQVQQAQPDSAPVQRLLGIVQLKLHNFQEAASNLGHYLDRDRAYYTSANIWLPHTCNSSNQIGHWKH